ncbi:type IV pilus assembly protein PilX [Tahibacter aquaticus]|uniref:Type IV pilus assembly protein PilX n=1 Tax=Tahibacter aquaticus TaxID=520092 RepID=A0A4V3DNI7_9GAMM|nr:PilX N-terminal domain-containing pilus assembly protein [Tahibacter aquaticus]TDR48556.1 type IV pilus assembly protein PilX [Tahibacter aquaticus]
MHSGTARDFSLPQPRRQRGAVLFVALMFLIVITLLALSSSGTAVLQERMTGGMRNNQLGLMGGDSALRGAEFDLYTMAEANDRSGSLSFSCGYEGVLGGCFRKTYGEINPLVQRFRNSPPGYLPPLGRDVRVYAPVLTNLPADRATASLAQQPRQLIEDLGEAFPSRHGRMAGAASRLAQGSASDPEALHHYRITARSTGGSDAVNRIAESTFLALVPKSYNP